MDNDELLRSLRADAPALRAAARAADPNVAIEACPAWTPVDLVWHVGEAHHFWATVVGDKLQSPDGYVRPARPDTDEGVDAFAADSAELLLNALSSTDPATPVWTWSDQKDAGFVIRRMAQETAVHRVDAEHAAGHDHRIDAETASDGIDEFLEFFATMWRRDDALPLNGSVHLHCTDAAGEWLVTTDSDDNYVVTREHAKGDAAMRGSAHDLLMVLWRRSPIDNIDCVGDVAVAQRFVARTDLD